MGTIADFSKYKARRDYSKNLTEKGWIPGRVEKAHTDCISIYIYDDYTQLLLFSNVQQANLNTIIDRVADADQQNLLAVAEKLSDLISDFGVVPPYQGDNRLSVIAQTAVWFAGFSLSLINAQSMKSESLVIFRLVDTVNAESTFHLAHLDWPDVMERNSAASQLSVMAKKLRKALLVNG